MAARRGLSSGSSGGSCCAGTTAIPCNAGAHGAASCLDDGRRGAGSPGVAVGTGRLVQRSSLAGDMGLEAANFGGCAREFVC